MRTNIVLNDKLVAEAFRYAPVTTKRELIEIALREYIEHHQRADLRDLKTKILIDPDYDYKNLRKSE